MSDVGATSEPVSSSLPSQPEVKPSASSTPESRASLIALIEAHHHSYDSDCGSDHGCSCGTKTQRYEPDDYPDDAEWWGVMEKSRAAHAEHLADVIALWALGV